ncbi:MAG: phosphopantothenoylcysteine decarboxylase [Victivallaceae bacterium]|nr:phosphopantothenoylcysteine decarboxylase [Victivallaceae bacterium]
MKIVVSAGPTREKIDPVRFLSNRSTGRMGYALAEAAAALGHETILVSGPTALAHPTAVRFVGVESAAEMAAAIKREAADADCVIMAAAVADYRPKYVAAEKIKKSGGSLTLELERTEDILATLGAETGGNCRRILVGFAAETECCREHALEKLIRKNLDYIALNDVSRSDRGFCSENNALSIYARDGRCLELPLASKREIAAAMLEIVLTKPTVRNQSENEEAMQ